MAQPRRQPVIAKVFEAAPVTTIRSYRSRRAAADACAGRRRGIGRTSRRRSARRFAPRTSPRSARAPPASTTAPVGLLGELRMTPRTRSVAAALEGLRAVGVPAVLEGGRDEERAARPSAAPSRETRPSRARRARPRRPRRRAPWQTLKTACLAPAVTMTFSRPSFAPCSRGVLRGDRVPQRGLARDVGVLGAPGLDRARRPRGRRRPVSAKSGSPIEKSTTSTPEAASALAFRPAAVVEEGASAAIRRDRRKSVIAAPSRSARTRRTP